ncbi:hypothetical protein D0Y65_021658, partial [Glycine soja]
KVPEAKAGECGSVKDSLFITKNLRNLFNYPIFDTFVYIACGLRPLHGERSTFSIPFPNSLMSQPL